MTLFFIYSIKVALCLTAFYLVYKLLLSRETFFGFNRSVLLSMTVLSLLLPLVHVTAESDVAAVAGFVIVEDAVAEVVAYKPQGSVLTPASACFAIYIIGVALFAVREVWSLLSLRRLLRGGRVVESDGRASVVVVKCDVAPFSWMGTIVISEKDYADRPGYILAHERAHVAARHSWDILACDVLTVFQWFNPSVWLLKAELQAVHEYEADRRVLASGIDASDYQLLLVRKAVGERLFTMANNLNQCSLKKRITMMMKRKSSPWSRMKTLVALPVAAVAVAAFATPKAESLSNEIKSEGEALVSAVTDAVSADTLKGKTVGLMVTRVGGEDLHAVEENPDEGGVAAVSDSQPDGDVYDVVEEMPEFPGGHTALMQFLVDNIKYPADAVKDSIQGRVIVQFVVGKDGTVGDAKILRGVAPSLDKESLRVIGAMPKWKPGKQNGEVVNVKYTLPVKFSMADESDKKSGFSKVYYLVDGKRVKDISNIKPADIESIEEFKDKAHTVDKYGPEAKDGVISIKLKKK